MKKESSKRPTILVVDDEPSVRNLIVAIISDKYSCTTASNAEEALELLKHNTYDLVISDINLGGMSGIALIQHIADSAPETVVLMVSGDQTIDSPIEAIRGGAYDYLRKPFNIDQVVVAVDRALEHSKLLSSKKIYETRLEELVDERTQRLNYLAYHDALTGLSNQLGFEETLDSILNKGDETREIAVLSAKLKRLNGLKETVGHKVSDRLLIEVAGRLANFLPDAHSIGRLEGDEFVLIVPAKSDQEAINFANLLLSAFVEPFSIGEYKVFVSMNVGICRPHDDGTDVATLLTNASSARSHASKIGANRYHFYTSSIHEAAIRRLTLENDMRSGIDRSEFEMLYQPKVDMVSGAVTGMEALVRWNHPRFGVISPLEFIPLAEETGLIVPLGEWILRTVCDQTRAWHDEGLELNVAVNISPAQLEQEDLAQKINAIVNRSGIDPKYLNIEITESSIMNNLPAAVKVLCFLRETGITVSIDDFGTGQSSLGYLKRLPIDIVKIDKSFVDDVSTNPDDAALVMAIVTLAHNLRLKVVVEGVETDDQLRFLKLMRCDEWQGYLFSKPLSAPAFRSLIDKTNEQHNPRKRRKRVANLCEELRLDRVAI